ASPVKVIEPAKKFVASVLITKTKEVKPGAIGGPNEKPTRFPAAFRSAKEGGIIPLTKNPRGREAPSVLKPTCVAVPVKLMVVSRATASPEPEEIEIW